MPWPDRLNLRAENLGMDLVVVKEVTSVYDFLVPHCVGVVAHGWFVRKLALGFAPNFPKI